MAHDSETTKTSIIQAALTCFSEHGFDRATMRMIAKVANRPISLLAHHFGNKEGLYQDVFRWIFEHYFVIDNADIKSREGVTPRTRDEAVRLFRHQVHILYNESSPAFDHPGLPGYEEATKLMMQEIRDPRPCLHPLLLQFFAPRIELIKTCIAFLRPEFSEDEACFIGISVVGATVGHGLMRGMNRVVWPSMAPPSNAFENAEILVDIILKGLVPTDDH